MASSKPHLHRLFKLLSRLQILRDFGYFEHYFTVLALVTSRQQHRSPTVLLRRLQLRLYQAILLGAAAFSMLRVLYQDSTSRLLNIAQYNLAYIEGFRGHWNFWMGAFALFAAYCYELIYFRNCGLSARWLHTVLIRRQCLYFIWPFYENQKLKKVVGVSLKPISIVQYMQYGALLAMNAFQVTFVCNFLYLLSMQLRIIFEFSRKALFVDFFGLAAFASFQFFAFLTHLTFHIGLQSLILIAVLGLTLIKMNRLRLCQLHQFIHSLQANRMHRFRLATFLHLNDFTIQQLPDINRIYGKAVLAFLLIGLPTNAICIMMLTLNHTMTISLQIIFSVIVLFEIFFIFIVHLSLALISLRIHSPAKRLITLYSQCSGSFGFGFTLAHKLKLTRYFEQFHTRNLFTVNYGRCGRITIRSFSRHLLYYFKMLFFAYSFIYYKMH